MKKILFVLIMLFLCQPLMAQRVIDIPTQIPEECSWGFHCGMYFNGQWIEGTEEWAVISDVGFYELGERLYKNRYWRGFVNVINQFPMLRCGPMWNDVYGKDIVIIRAGSQELLQKCSLVSIRSEGGLPCGVNIVRKEGILKFTPIYPDDKEAGITGLRDGDIFHVWVNGHKTVEEFVFSSGYKQHEIEVLTIE